jgi:hypothetical protein
VSDAATAGRSLAGVSEAGNVRVELRRSGGIAGITMVSALDTATADPATAAIVDSALANVDLPALAASGAAASSGADRFQYDLTVDKDGERHSLSLGESALPAELRPLVQALVAKARPG